MASSNNKIVLAYSGGLDTSIILKWLQQERNYEVHTFTADIGQGEDLHAVQEKATALGAKFHIEDLCEEFVRDFVFPMFRANAIYEGEYLLGTSIARPLIAKRLVEIAKEVGANAIAHGATGKGNDQIRFELGAYALNPDIEIVAPWREWDLASRTDLLAYAKQHGIEVELKGDKPPYSIDANLLHISYEGDILEDPWNAPEATMWQRTQPIEQTPDTPLEIEIGYQKGDPVSINGKALSPAALLAELNTIAGQRGIGRADIVENRYIGMKSRGCYETPGGTVLLKAHRAIESLTLDREVAHLKDEMMSRYATLIYNGYWWSQERLLMQKMIDESQSMVNGTVRLHLLKGNVMVTGRNSPNSLLDQEISSFEDDRGRFDQRDAEGFIKLNALRLRLNRPQ